MESVLPFLEIGEKSGHFYQPDVNHRSLDPKVLYNTSRDKNGGEVPPMLKSLLRPGVGDDFTTQTPMSLFMYELSKSSDSNLTDVNGATIQTILPWKIQGHLTKRGKLENCYA